MEILTPSQPQTLLSLQTTAAATTAKGILFLGGKQRLVTIVLESADTTSGGTVVIEEAYYTPDDVPYTGTWSQLGATINASSFSGGAQLAVHLVNYSCWAVRVRIATDITGGGSVSAYGWAN